MACTEDLAISVMESWTEFALVMIEEQQRLDQLRQQQEQEELQQVMNGQQNTNDDPLTAQSGPRSILLTVGLGAPSPDSSQPPLHGSSEKGDIRPSPGNVPKIASVFNASSFEAAGIQGSLDAIDREMCDPSIQRQQVEAVGPVAESQRDAPDSDGGSAALDCDEDKSRRRSLQPLAAPAILNAGAAAGDDGGAATYQPTASASVTPTSTASAMRLNEAPLDRHSGPRVAAGPKASDFLLTKRSSPVLGVVTRARLSFDLSSSDVSSLSHALMSATRKENRGSRHNLRSSLSRGSRIDSPTDSIRLKQSHGPDDVMRPGSVASSVRGWSPDQVGSSRDESGIPAVPDLGKSSHDRPLTYGSSAEIQPTEEPAVLTTDAASEGKVIGADGRFARHADSLGNPLRVKSYGGHVLHRAPLWEVASFNGNVGPRRVTSEMMVIRSPYSQSAMLHEAQRQAESVTAMGSARPDGRWHGPPGESVVTGHWLDVSVVHLGRFL